MSKVWRLLFALALIGAAYGLRAPWLTRDVWNLDEGSTFTMAEQVLHGGVIYRDAADNRSPLMPYLKAAVFAVCGDWNAHAVHVAVALMLGAGAVLLWLTARRLGDEKPASSAPCSFWCSLFSCWIHRTRCRRIPAGSWFFSPSSAIGCSPTRRRGRAFGPAGPSE
jgi:hypothetical protein